MKKVKVFSVTILVALTVATANEAISIATNSPAIVEAASKKKKTKVPREYKNALKAAKNYINIMPFSKQKLYDQLTSDVGNKYPAEAATYAVENVKANWKKEALEAANGYQEIMPMSDQELYDQLTSEAGDKFTAEEAQYAIDNLNK